MSRAEAAVCWPNLRHGTDDESTAGGHSAGRDPVPPASKGSRSRSWTSCARRLSCDTAALERDPVVVETLEVPALQSARDVAVLEGMGGRRGQGDVASER